MQDSQVDANLPGEEWDVHEPSGIRVSDQGRVVSRGRKTLGTERRGHYTTRKDGKEYKIERLVLETFHPIRCGDWGNLDGKGIVAWGDDDKLNNKFDNIYWWQFAGGWTEAELGYNCNSYWLAKRRQVTRWVGASEYGRAYPAGVVPPWFEKNHPVNFNWWRRWYASEFKLGAEAVEVEMRKDMPEFKPDYVNKWAPPDFGKPPAAP